MCQIFFRFQKFFHQSIPLAELRRMVKEFLKSEKYFVHSWKNTIFWERDIMSRSGVTLCGHCASRRRDARCHAPNQDFFGSGQIFLRSVKFFHQSIPLAETRRLAKEFLKSRKYMSISEKSWFFWYAYYIGSVTKYVRPAVTLHVTLKASRQKNSHSGHIDQKVWVIQCPQTKGCFTPRASYLFYFLCSFLIF